MSYNYFEEKGFWEKHKWKVILALIILIGVFPIQVDGYITEHYTEEEEYLEKEKVVSIDCDFKLTKAGTFEKSYTELGDALRIIVDVASTQNIDLEIQSSEKKEIKKTGKIFNYNITAKGTSLVVILKNPSLPILGYDANLSGKIEVYHEYITTRNIDKTRQVPGKVLRIWWMSD